MRLVGVKLFLLLLLGFATSLQAQEKYDVPPYKGHINDFAGVIQAADMAMIEAKLKAYEDSTSTQIAVVIESSLNGKDVYNRTLEFARGWGVGSKEKNNGVVLYLSVGDRKYHTLTSQATQGVLTDGIVGQIQREFLIPNLRAGNYTAAIDQTTTAYIQALKGEFVAGKKANEGPGWGLLIVIIIIVIFILFINNNNHNGRGFKRGGVYWFPTGGFSGGGWGGNGGGGGGGWGGFGGGGGFDGGGAGGSW
ncbi:MAG: TPM domain-containing protein [Bacteroidia bacterium]|nr:TPM domain-containing protein [Bacteroidia bacterium]